MNTQLPESANVPLGFPANGYAQGVWGAPPSNQAHSVLKNPGFNVCILEGTEIGCVSTPAYMAPILSISLVFFIFIIGYLLGKVVGSRKAIRKVEILKNSPEDIAKFLQRDSSVFLSYTFIISGLLLFILGASGTIELEIPGAKIVTSLPGLIVIFLGYKTWNSTLK